MPEQIANPVSEPMAEAEIHPARKGPRGVLPKNLKPALYLGAAGLVITAAVFSGTGKKSPGQHAASSHRAPQPLLQDNTDRNAQEMRNQAATAEAKMAQQGATSANPPASASVTTPTSNPACLPGQSCNQPQQLSPAAQEQQQLAIKDRELAYDSRFASNLVYTRATADSSEETSSAVASTTGSQRNTTSIQPLPDPRPGSLIPARAVNNAPGNSVAPAATTKPEINIDAATGPPYVIYEGTTLDTVLMNRLDGDAPGPVKVLVSNPVYSHDRQHVLIPSGTVVLGEARKIGASGFGQQRRLAVVFHRMIMPDGYSVDLDQFHGLDQIGEEGLKDKVNNHYLQIFGTSIALGVISGAGEIEEGGGTISTSGSQAFASGSSASVSQSASTILDRFMNIPPTITIREGHRVKVYFTQDMLLPAYEHHTIPQTF